MTTIPVLCRCDRLFEVAEDRAGQLERCPRCGHEQVVVDPWETVLPVLADDPSGLTVAAVAAPAPGLARAG